MKKLLLSAFAVASLSAVGFPQMMEGMHGSGSQGGMMQQPMQSYGYYYQPMMPMMMMPMMGMMGMGMHGGGMMGMGGMGMMVMPHDPETMKLIQEHKKKCKKELMQKLAQKRSEAMAEHMLRMMAMHPEAFKKVIQENPQLKKKLRELVR